MNERDIGRRTILDCSNFYIKNANQMRSGYLSNVQIIKYNFIDNDGFTNNSRWEGC